MIYKISKGLLIAILSKHKCTGRGKTEDLLHHPASVLKHSRRQKPVTGQAASVR